MSCAAHSKAMMIRQERLSIQVLRCPIGWTRTNFLQARVGRLFDLPVQGLTAGLGLITCDIELLEVSDEIVDALFVFQSGKDHLSARHFCFRVSYVFAEGRLIPNYT
jgi:hypothetical protein